ncbi:MAG: low-specificity L-threonine aldolase [Candidatus Marinimicrobia bacterium]|nr:low-specificity L-threonine aldolase [Candidatus Neomarinimicrobiota bacterium]MDP6456792.1 low-specificity L-threonine aldolase [Candidatus Neomarinimicrobiota bacterium]MDP6593869.1 low-specificity L-threonine aldolase [Candidatus Neomarinimicrobiota bacterium]MDP6835894.1 low-specificity L-threonine aldolase [Candidatus Neomarinimicrobiota bacterium]MDP6966728.1 low-specificity L-threonine aldolase [Candidatus Neomarinimicrobiota bacterium]|tara:strand:- start:819 stop:1856 length:1038 start_codon:yes stop_codon:yes gene_type:complete
MKVIDLRSDTVTLPTDAMRQAIFDAELGDDVFEDDPTVNRLERRTADIIGKEAALLVPSGTMANLVSVLTHCERGDEVILGDKAHTFLYEAGGISAYGGIHPRTLKNQPDGTIDLNEMEAAIRADNVHFPRTRLICLENTHNVCHGVPLTKEYMDDVADFAHRREISLHVDGARIFNAAVTLGLDADTLVANAESVSFCLSKGLSAPVGSLVCGTEAFIRKARRVRKGLGGGMRQAGIVAASGLVALDETVERLAEDHANARRLAEGIDAVPGLEIDLGKVYTNILYFDLVDNSRTADEVVSAMEDEGIRFLTIGPGKFRMVTNRGVDAGDVDSVLSVLNGYFSS